MFDVREEVTRFRALLVAEMQREEQERHHAATPPPDLLSSPLPPSVGDADVPTTAAARHFRTSSKAFSARRRIQPPASEEECFDKPATPQAPVATMFPRGGMHDTWKAAGHARLVAATDRQRTATVSAANSAIFKQTNNHTNAAARRRERDPASGRLVRPTQQRKLDKGEVQTTEDMRWNRRLIAKYHT